MKGVGKLRSKTGVYNKIIEVQVPVRFYWDEDGYDGFEFGPLQDCSRYQLRLLDEVVGQLYFEHNYARVAAYLKENHYAEWQNLLGKMEAEALNIPQAFFDAFRED